MKRLACSTLAGCAALAIVLSASPATAQDPSMNRTTHVTTTGPIELPNLTLPAGEYTFRLNDMHMDRNVVHITSRDGLQHFASVLAIAATRTEPAEDTVITFREAPAGAPAPIRYWFYPGSVLGHEFVYPREQALRIAQASNEDVLTADDAGSVERMTQERVRAMTPQGEERDIPDTATAAEQRMAQQPAAATGTPEQQTGERVGTAGQVQMLPRTASPLPLVGLLGLLSLAGALTARRFSR